MLHQAIFLYFAAVILGSAILMITRRNVVHSVLFMLLLFFHIAGLFVLLNAEFLAAVQLIVYAGAILILYLFVVMLLNIEQESKTGRSHRYWGWMTAFGVLIIGEIALLVLRGSFPAEAAGQVMRPGMGDIKELGAELFTNYLVPFEIASVILLVGLVGAVMLAQKNVKE